MKPDAVDVKILQALMDDARASLRQIARRARMMKAGLIKKFVPILSADSANLRVLALVTLKTGSSSAEKTARDLARLREVEAVYMTTGQSITFKVSLDSVQELRSFLNEKVLRRRGAEITSSQMITSTVKEEPPSLLPSMLAMNLKCDYCGGEVTSSRPYTLGAGSSHYYFCRKTRKKAYLDKHGRRLAKARRVFDVRQT